MINEGVAAAMYKCPIDYYTDNLIFNADKSCWAAFKLTGFDYDYLSVDGKIEILNKIIRVLVSIMSEAQILIIPIEQDTEEHFKRLRERIKRKDSLFDVAIEQATKTEEYLKQTMLQNGAVNDYRTYLIIKLEQAMEYEAVEKIKDAFQYFIKDPVNAINVQMRLDTKDILASKIRQARKLADDWLFSNNIKLNMVETDKQETQWLFRRMAFRGTNKAVKLFYKTTDREAWEPRAEEVEANSDTIVKPLRRDIVNLFSGTIYREERSLKIQTDTTTSYQAFFVITGIPEVCGFPGLEWIYMLQQYNVQAEICIHVKVLVYRLSLKKLDIKKREINSQMEHIAESNNDIPESLLESKEYADIMESELKNSRSPILQATVGICLADADKDLLEKKCSIIREAYEDMNFIVERPLSDQTKLFMQFIPSVGVMIKDFAMPLTPKTLAAGVIGATHELGDSVGPFIGTTGLEKKQVYLDMGEASLQNKSPAATFFGNLGVGKSFNANLLLYLNIIYGGYGLIFDPKGERGHWEKNMLPLKGLITTVTLGSDSKDRGKLDPYNVYKNDVGQANELAINVICELFKISPTSEEYTALLEAARRIQEGNTPPSMMKFAQILDSFPEEDYLKRKAENISRRLKLQQNNGMAQLLIGEGTEEAITLENRLNILQIQNLKMPSPETEKQDYTIEETLSTVIMMVLSQFARQFALVKRPVFKIILFDESWMLGKTKEGVKLYEFLSRMGRSLYTGVIYNGHSVLDIPTEGIRNTITYKFCFQTTNMKEAERMLEYLNLENTEGNRELLKSLGNGECLFQDLSGHVGRLKFDAVFKDLIDIFSTTPKTEDDNQQKESEKQPEIKTRTELENQSKEETGRRLYTEEWLEPEKISDSEIWPEQEIDIYKREEV